jgi:transposase
MSAESNRSRRQYSLAEKMAIVRESQQPGVSQASISRKYRLGKNVLWTWRKSLTGFSLGLAADANDTELINLRERIAELERLLGRKAFEIEMLKSRLQDRQLQTATI